MTKKLSCSQFEPILHNANDDYDDSDDDDDDNDNDDDGDVDDNDDGNEDDDGLGLAGGCHWWLHWQQGTNLGNESQVYKFTKLSCTILVV